MVSYKQIATTDGCGPSNPPIIDLSQLYRIGKIEFGTDRNMLYNRWIRTSSDCSSYTLLYTESSPATIVWTGDITTRCIKCEIDYGANIGCANIKIYELLYTNFLSISSDKYLIAYPDNQFILSGAARDQYSNPIIDQTINITVFKDTTTYFSGAATTDQNGNFSVIIFTSSGQTFWPAGTYTVTVVSDSISRSIEIQTYESGNIAFTSTCSDTLQPCPADVYIDNNPTPIATTPITVTLPVGDHTYRISYPGYIDKTGIQTVELGATYPINVTLDRQPNILFNTNPQDANIYINAILQPNVTPTGIYLPPGIYDYILRLPCYEDILGQFTVPTTPEIIPIDKTFIKNTGDLSITSTPAGANVYIDATLQSNNTPLNYICNQSNYIYLSEGTHSYTIFSPGYQSYKGTYNIIRNILTNINVTLFPLGTTGTGSIYISTIPPGAKIFVDNIDTGLTTPNIVTNIPTGEHTIILNLDGYQISTSTIIIEDNTTIDVQISLVPPAEGCIYFNSSPQGAKIFVDNIDTGLTTPNTICGLSLGIHTYRLTAQGYQDITGSTDLTTGQGNIISDKFVQVVEAGFGGVAILLIAGIAIGAIYSSQKKERQK